MKNKFKVGLTCIMFLLTGLATQAQCTLSLTSVAATTSQTVCINTAITNITYTFADNATGANVTGLPTGVTASTVGAILTISGSPSASGTFNYSVTTVGCSPNQSVLLGTITVNPLHTIVLTSAVGTNIQTRCVNAAITNITYLVGGGATSATVSGLPLGITSTFAAGTLTIFGSSTSAGISNFSVSTTANSCASVVLNGTLTIVPLHTISLLVAGTNNQTRCANQAITNIAYTIGGGATNAAVNGLPNGISGALSGNTFTISGSSTVEGVFNFTVTTSGNICSSVPATGTLTISSGNGLALASAAATTNQTRCVNNSITNIVYSLSGGSTGGNVSGLPMGVSFVATASSITISGTPSVAGVFNYTVSATGSTCGSTSLTGVITVTALHTLSLTSAGATTTQNICQNQGLINITYILGGGATAANVSSLPTGVTFTLVGATLTISGAPTQTGNFNYTVTTTANACNSATATGSINVSPGQNITLSSALSTISQTVCSGAAITNITYSLSGSANNATVSGLPIGVSMNISGTIATISGIPSQIGTFNYTVSTSGTSCVPATAIGTITVSAGHTLTLTSGTENQTRCSGAAITNIVYTFGGGATNASVSGLPSGITQVVSGNTLTLSGASAIGGTFNFTVTTSGNPCTVASRSGTFTISAGHTLVLNSSLATTNQSLCINQAISTINYTFSSGATGATVSGLPSGINSNISGSNVSISGTVTSGGIFNYSIVTTGNACPAVTLTGTITVSVNNTINLTSAPNSTSQTVCQNSAISNIVYSFSGGTSGASASGLPTGVTSSTSGNNFTISGIPTLAGIFNYTITATGNTCNSSSATGTITVNQLPNFVIPTGSPSVCQGTTSVVVNGTPTNNPNAFSITWTTPPSGVSNIPLTNFPVAFNIGSSSPVGAVNGNLLISNANGCVRGGIPITLTISPNPIIQTVTQNPVCSGTNVGPFPIQITNIAAFSTPLSVSGNWTIGTTSAPINSIPFNIPTFTALSQGGNVTPVNVNAIVTINGCTSSLTNISSFNVNPVPTITVNTLSPACEGTSFGPIQITTDLCGITRHIWTTNNQSVGLPNPPSSVVPFTNCSTTVISSFTGLNTGSTNNISTITITPSTATCTGIPITTQITVRPIPVLVTAADVAVCSGSNFPSTQFTTEGPIANSVFTWSISPNNPTSPTFTGISGSTGTGNLPAFSSVNIGNSTSVPGVITVTVSAAGCSSQPTIFRNITVRPKLELQVINGSQINPAIIEFCNGTEVLNGTINFTDDITIPETINVQWVKDAGDISALLPAELPSSGAQSTLPTFVAENANNTFPFVSSNFTVSGNYTILGTNNVCTSSPINFEIRVNPGPRLTIPASFLGDTVCNNGQFSEIDLSEIVEPSTANVSWTCSNGDIDGIGGIITNFSVDSNKIFGFIGRNLPPSISDVNAIFTITLSDNSTSCTSSSNTFRVKVRPQGTIDNTINPFPNPLTICDGFLDTLQLFTNLEDYSNNISFQRSETGTWGSSTLSGNNLFLTPNLGGGTTVQSGAINITPTVEGCIGVPYILDVQTSPNPQPPLIIAENDTICANAQFQFFSSSTNILNSSYRWSLSPSNVGFFEPDETFNNVLVNFSNTSAQNVTVSLKTTDNITTCASSNSINIVLLNTDASIITGEIIAAQINNEVQDLFFFQPTSLIISQLQWGFEDLTNMNSTEIPNSNGPVLSSALVGSLNGGLNAMVNATFANGGNNINRYLFWVKIESFGCSNKVYFIANGSENPTFPLDLKNIIHADLNFENTFIVAPNPSLGIFNLIDLSKRNQRISYELYDISGRRLVFKSQADFGNMQQIDLSKYPSGIYFLQVQNAHSEHKSFKLIKN